MNINKLKPCPFCGGKVSEAYTEFQLLCRRCKACNSKTGYFPRHVGDNEINDAWNKRPETAWEMFRRLLVIDEFREKLEIYMLEKYSIKNHFYLIAHEEEQRAIEIMQKIEKELNNENRTL